MALDEPRSLEFDDGFGGEDGQPAADRPVTRARVDLQETPGGTPMTVRSRFATLEQLEQVLARGAEERLRLSVGQIDDVLLATV